MPEEVTATRPTVMLVVVSVICVIVQAAALWTDVAVLAVSMALVLGRSLGVFPTSQHSFVYH